MPQQLGFEITGSAEAAGKLDEHHWIIKLDFKNNFNSLCRDKILLAIQKLYSAV